MKRFLLSLVALAFLTVGANAATCFAVGGTFTWDNSTDAAHWSNASGGSGSTCAATGGVPKNAADIATLDGSSGGGTVTNNVDINIAQINMGAFTGTLDFATNNHNVTLSTSFVGSGAGTRTLNMGNGTWTMTGTGGTSWNMATTTGLTFNANSSILSFTGTTTANRTFNAGALTYATVNFGANSSLGPWTLTTIAGTVIGTLTVAGPNYFIATTNVTLTVSNAFTINGASSAFIYFSSSTPSATAATISVASGSPTFSWAVLKDMTFTGGATFTATNSLDAGNNTGITITAPSFGGGGRIIGG